MSSAPRILGLITAAAMLGSLAACGSGPGSHPAGGRPPAGARPVRVQPDVTGWSGMVQRPHVIYVGMGGAPVARQLAWRQWGRPTAWATGKLDLYWPQPGPVSGWHPTSYPVTVRLRDIQRHNGQPFYRTMAYSYVNRRGVTKVLQFVFSVQPGGSAPNWNPTRTATAPPVPAGVAQLTAMARGCAGRGHPRGAVGVPRRVPVRGRTAHVRRARSRSRPV